METLKNVETLLSKVLCLILEIYSCTFEIKVIKHKLET